MNSYEAKQEAKRERLERAADNATTEANARYKAAQAATAGIEFGQPILVGHHSEGRHRAAIRRSDTNMRKMCEALDRAKELEARAAAVGTGGISSDDPKAIAKLEEKRTDLEITRDWMKALNAHYKTHQNLDLDGCPDSLVRSGRSTLVHQAYYGVPFPPYSLSNIGARIRDAKKRAGRIEAAREIPASTEELGRGFVLVADPDSNRVVIRCAARLSKEHYQLVRSAGFVWARTVPGFVRKLSLGALAIGKLTVERIIDQLESEAIADAEASIR